MLRDKRDYLAIIFTPAQYLAKHTFPELFPACDVEVADDVFDETSWTLSHCFLYTKEKFSNSSELLNELSVRRNRRTVYRYNFYLAKYSTKQDNLVMLAAPFRKMEQHLIDNIVSSKTSSTEYGRPLLQELVERISEGKHAKGRLRLRGLEYFVPADENGNIFAIEGQNVLRAELYQTVRNRLIALGAFPRSVRLEFAEDSFRPLKMTLDRFGNFHFRIGSKRDNLVFLRPILDYLNDQHLIASTRNLPLDAIPEDNSQ